LIQLLTAIQFSTFVEKPIKFVYNLQCVGGDVKHCSIHLTGIFRQRPDSLPQLVVAASTDRSDVSRQRQLAIDDDAEVTSCVLGWSQPEAVGMGWGEDGYSVHGYGWGWASVSVLVQTSTLIPILSENPRRRS